MTTKIQYDGIWRPEPEGRAGVWIVARYRMVETFDDRGNLLDVPLVPEKSHYRNRHGKIELFFDEETAHQVAGVVNERDL